MFEEGTSIASTVTARRFTASTGRVKPAEVAGRHPSREAHRGLQQLELNASSRASFIR